MSQLLGLSFDGLASPSITLGGWERRDAAAPPSGWGFAWYPSQDFATAVLKDPIAMGETAMTEVLRDWDRFRATVFVCHLRGAAKRVTQEDTHPFSKTYAGRDWVLAHNGDFDPDRVHSLELHPVFEPIGRTDSERAFCWILSQALELGARRLADFGWQELLAFLRQLDDLGTTNLILTDGEDLVAYRDAEGFNALHAMRRRPPHAQQVLSNRYLELSLAESLDMNRTGVIVSTTPLSGEGWAPIGDGQMIVARRGSVIWTSEDRAEAAASAGRKPGHEWVEVGSAPRGAPAPSPGASWGSASSPRPGAADTRSIETSSPISTMAHERILTVLHETAYEYDEPVERSTHLLRLRPVDDAVQQIVDHSLVVEPHDTWREFEDVFGNHTVRAKIESPYSKLRIAAKSLVRLSPHRALVSPERRATIPLVWMPWQRQMMVPYLLPPELPETQLRELSDFAMSFAERQDYDLDATLADMNRSIFRDFEYVSGSTHLETTPFDVYVNRRGVCQDFANLLICLARLINVPARYRVGYIYTGADYTNREQGDASHAWVEVYLPYVGWRGYDPTNGRLAGLDHVRVAVGRNYRDATPTSGTIFKGGGNETLTVSVEVSVRDDPERSC